MSFRNDSIPKDTVPITGAEVASYMGLLVLATTNISYKTAAGNTRTLTAVPAGVTIICQIVEIVSISVSGAALGYVA